MSNRSWHLKEFDRISASLLSLKEVTSVNLYGSVELGNHDQFSDLDIIILSNPLLSPQSLLELFEENVILGQERYWGKESALLRLLLHDGKQFDLKILSIQPDTRDRTWIPIAGTDNFWFALHASLHALIRDNEIVALDLILAAYRSITLEYWQVDEERKELVLNALKSLNLQMGRDGLISAIRHTARVAGVTFNDETRSLAFLQIIGEHQQALEERT